MKKTLIALSAAFLLSFGGSAMAEEAASSPFKYGGDVRFRWVDIEEIPFETGNDWGQRQYQRTRTRAWASYDHSPNLSGKIRLTNEFWDYYNDSAVTPDSVEFLSEVVFDNAYVDFKNLSGGKLDVRVGRQDLVYGTGKVILDGTPEDGSRTIYFNAAKATAKMDGYSVDVVGVLNQAQDELAINDQQRALAPNDENGLIVYVKNNRIEKAPQEYYYIFKQEEDDAGVNDLEFHTVGARFMPKFSDRLSGNLEVAVQNGDYDAGGDVGGWMLDAKLAYAIPVAREGLKATADLSYYHLSGDDANSGGDNEGWRQVWGRFPQYSELYVYSYIKTGAGGQGPGWWTNLSMPSAGISLNLDKKIDFQGRAALLFAPEELASSGGTGDKRGTLLTTKTTYNYSKKLDFRVVYEHFSPGDYYVSSAKNAHFFQFQTQVHF